MHNPPDVRRADPDVFAVLLCTTLTTLVYQVLLTRIFSVTMWYHYSFMAISVSMFGMTVGAILVYLRPAWFPPSAARERMGQAALCFAVLMVLTFLTHLCIPFNVRLEVVHLWSIAVNYAILSLPFVASGVLVTIALTRFPLQVGQLYAVDLVGAGLGCLVVVTLLRFVDAPTLVLDTAALAALGGGLCLVDAPSQGVRRTGLGITLALVGLAMVATTMAVRHAPLVRLAYVKGLLEEKPLYERWNAFSRVAISPYNVIPFGWGLSERYHATHGIEQLHLQIDAGAGTVLTHFVGEAPQFEHLSFDVTNLAHAIRPKSRVLVVGVGGGRDILSALYFRQPEIVGVEINDAILEALRSGPTADFTGHLDLQEGVRLVNDEARSYIARSDETFDIIQVSLIDTWAATGAGAYVLTENSLYTIEGWQRLLGHLSDHGVLSFSRWFSHSQPGETYRLTALAVASLERLGIDKPRDHLLVINRPRPKLGVATLLASRTPFSAADIDTIELRAAELGFEVLLSPRAASDETLAQLADCTTPADLEAFTDRYPIDISPPTDDRPFFFNMLRMRDIFSSRLWDLNFRANMVAVATLAVLLATVLVLTGLCVIVPLWLTTDRRALAGSLPLFMYFCSIGFGFMAVEITLMQRLNVFLGHPSYSMTVVLFCLLVAGGAGSWLSGLLVRDVARGPWALLCLAALVAVVLGVGLFSSTRLSALDAAPTPTRIAIACGLLLPLGLAMGMGFPLGMRLASRRSAALTPWLFGINGATSICGSVLAVTISLTFSISTALFVGVACYTCALVAFWWGRRGAPETIG